MAIFYRLFVMRDKTTGRPRGFGFVVFADPSILDRVLQDKHTIDSRTVEAKKALSREEQQTSARAGNLNPARNNGSGGNIRTKKIFVGGLPPTLTEDGFRQYFEAFGHVTDVVIMYDQNTQRPRGFGFISFDSEDAVDRVLRKTFHDLNGKQVEGYSASGGNTNSYDGRMDSNSGPPGAPRSSWSSQAPSGYGAMGYGNAASWGAPNIGAGSGGPSSTPTGQSPSGTAGYGNQGYGYGSYGGNDGSYGNPAGYGAVGGRSGGTPNSNFGGAGELQGSGSGYMGSGYGDANGNPGYGNAGWRSEPSQASGNYGTPQANGPHGGQVGYGGGGDARVLRWSHMSTHRLSFIVGVFSVGFFQHGLEFEEDILVEISTGESLAVVLLDFGMKLMAFIMFIGKASGFNRVTATYEFLHSNRSEYLEFMHHIWMGDKIPISGSVIDALAEFAYFEGLLMTNLHVAEAVSNDLFIVLLLVRIGVKWFIRLFFFNLHVEPSG
ncbi:hypothetical protein GH714_021647 [Hevea brasiliensis]|uniref:RRM domain-containing protein n=1 Tax=Hevea brasiliensis TaxID=3981 RepID=A0A6A6MNY1_HEVBR|nr:hypothetical protein GH714_021647 [Hevea brasiliensis]